MRFSYQVILILLFIAAIILAVLGITTGPASVSFTDVWKVLLNDAKTDSTEFAIIHYHRLPEVITAITVGAVLSVCGLMLQTLFKNPLAGPSILGISAGASFGVVLVLSGFAATGMLSGVSLDTLRHTLPFMALAGSLLVLVLMLLIYRISQNMFTVLLAGVMLSFFFSAMESVLLNLSSAATVKQFVTWGFGSFSSTGNDRMWLFLIAGIITVFLAFFLSRRMDALQFGYEQSRLAGINPATTQWLIILLCACMTGWVTAYCGPVGFIGLCVPHIARPLAKSVSHFKLISLCILIGICVSLFCLIITRLNLFHGTLPLNAVTSFLGAPFVIYILVKYRNQSAF